jgi:hypothetical protein
VAGQLWLSQDDQCDICSTYGVTRLCPKARPWRGGLACGVHCGEVGSGQAFRLKARSAMTRLLAATSLIFLVQSWPALAQDYIRQDCRGLLQQPSHAAFDDATHGLWYRRFWTGDCAGLLLCLSGKPNWNSAVGDLVSRTNAPRKQEVREKACRIGQTIGFEWARANNIRKIDTKDLDHFYTELQHSDDLSSTLDDIGRQAQSKLGR